MVKAYKLARSDGYDFWTGKTINYRENIGKVVKCPNANPKLGVCSSGVIHASEKPNDCFVGARIPCSAYIVEGNPVCGDAKKWGFTELLVEKEILNLDLLFGWNYSEAINPFNPLAGKKREPTQADIELLKAWDSVWASVWASVGPLVWASVWASVEASVWDSIWAYIGSLFPNTKPYLCQSCVDLWKQNLVPSFDGKIWRLHSGEKAEIVFEISKENL